MKPCCHQAGIGTCLDTCGYAATDKLKEVLAFTDYVLYDVKHMNAEFHKQVTGVHNDIILDNARVIAESGVQVRYRIPLIKDVNDTKENITNTAQFMKSLGNNASIELLPYHRLGI